MSDTANTSKSNVPLIVVGIVFGAVTFLFFIILVFISLNGTIITDQARYFIIIILAIGIAFSFAALGGSITVNVPLPGKIAINAGGGIGVFIGILILGYFFYVKNYLPETISQNDFNKKVEQLKTKDEKNFFSEAYKKEGDKYVLIDTSDKKKDSLKTFFTSTTIMEKLYNAAKNGWGDAYKEAIKDGADVNIGNKKDNGNTAIHYAAQNDYWKIIRDSMTYIKDINVKNNDGQTALHLAAKNSSVDCVTFLLNNGIDKNLKDKFGNTALELGKSEASKPENQDRIDRYKLVIKLLSR